MASIRSVLLFCMGVIQCFVLLSRFFWKMNFSGHLYDVFQCFIHCPHFVSSSLRTYIGFTLSFDPFSVIFCSYQLWLFRYHGPPLYRALKFIHKIMGGFRLLIDLQYLIRNIYLGSLSWGIFTSRQKLGEKHSLKMEKSSLEFFVHRPIFWNLEYSWSVSYTHLTLPTIYSV